MTQVSLYDRVVEVSRVYLGPAADRFIARQVQNHLKKKPEQLSSDDLKQLIVWIRIAVSMLTEDSKLIDKYTAQLEKLAQPAQRADHGKK